MTSVRREGLCPAALLVVAAVGILAASASIDEAYAHEGPSRTVAMNPEGLTIRPSSYGPKETMDRLAASVVDKGMGILARIDHAAAAAKAGKREPLVDLARIRLNDDAIGREREGPDEVLRKARALEQ